MVKRVLKIELVAKIMKSLCIVLGKTSGYRKHFSKTRYLSFFDNR